MDGTFTWSDPDSQTHDVFSDQSLPADKGGEEKRQWPQVGDIRSKEQAAMEPDAWRPLLDHKGSRERPCAEQRRVHVSDIPRRGNVTAVLHLSPIPHIANSSPSGARVNGSMT
ncbi:uncharacterized protein LOC121380642 [Gigantopelta aegis]|uniref:uncharacterized protein LOC121380642 n=1 Tax=Gigantopelta aegis TaxID=1735272 RepID=UPI001B88D1BA|nr:uncharacterized protein LOC121380642 [Gigantopelta aegis]